MGIENLRAKSGRHDMPDGVFVSVRYFRRAELSQRFNRGMRQDDARFRRVGWYWCVTGSEHVISSASTWHGPFTSSGRAYISALAEHQVQPS